MSDFGDKLEKLRVAKRLTQQQMADLLGITRQGYGNYESGKRQPDIDTLKKLASFFDVSADYLFGISTTVIGESLRPRVKPQTISVDGLLKVDSPQNTTANQFIRVPILGEIRAGYDLLAEQNIIGYSMVAREDVADGEYFLLRVKGDSMSGDRINEGDRVLVRRQDWVDDGKIAVVLVNGDEATLKRVYPQDGMVILQASNPAYPPKIVPADEIRIQGQVVKVEFDM